MVCTLCTRLNHNEGRPYRTPLYGGLFPKASLDKVMFQKQAGRKFFSVILCWNCASPPIIKLITCQPFKITNKKVDNMSIFASHRRYLFTCEIHCKASDGTVGRGHCMVPHYKGEEILELQCDVSLYEGGYYMEPKCMALSCIEPWPTVNRMIDTCKPITFPMFRKRRVGITRCSKSWPHY